MDVIEQIIAVRKSRGISQQKLADMTGILQPVIARVETRRSSPTIEFLERILAVLDLELTLTDAFNPPAEIKRAVKGLRRERINVGCSGDKVYVFGDKYVLKVSGDKPLLRLEKEKTEWWSKRIGGPNTIRYIEDERQGYYLRTYIRGHTLVEEQYLREPRRLISILRQVISILRSLDRFDCPYKSSDNEGTDFVHGDLCLPNIVVNDKDEVIGFLDLSNSGMGDKQYDYCWLLWSFEHNLKTNQYSGALLKELGIEINPEGYLHYVIPKIVGDK